MSVYSGVHSQTVTKNNYITVNPNPPVNFTVSPTSGCQPLDVQFNFINSGGVTSNWTWLWTLSSDSVCIAGNTTFDINRPNGNPFNYTLTDDGLYDVSLTVTNQFGCTGDTIINNLIDVFPKPIANFTYNVTPDCDLTTNVEFTSTSNIACSPNPVFNWDFGDGTSANVFTPTHIHEYLTSGTFVVRLIVTDGLTGNGCTDTTFQTIIVDADPTLTASASAMSVCLGESIQFTGNSSANVTSWLWNFGNGNTSTLQNPTFTFTNLGCRSVSLTIMVDSCSFSTALDTCIQVNPVPVGSFASQNAFEVCDQPHTMSFTSSVNGTLTPTYNWTFGDGTSSTVNSPTKTWNYAGIYPIALTVSTPQGCNSVSQVDTVIIDSVHVNFTQNTTFGCEPLTVNFTDNSTTLNNITNWLWRFGDGTTSTQQNPSHTYTTFGNYSVTLIVTTSQGCSDSLLMSNLISVGTPPNLNFTVSDNTPCANQAISFTNNSDPSGVDWTWFNGLNTVFGFTPPDTFFTSAGSYDVWLSAGLNGCYDTLQLNNFINIQLVEADFSNTGDCDIDPFLIHFTNNSNTGQGQGQNTYSWNFGTIPASTSTVENPSFTFPGSAVYEVTFVVTNADGCSDTTIQNVNLLQPIAAFGWENDDLGCLAADAIINLVDTSQNYDECSWLITGATYVFGTDATSCPPVITYDSAGIYQIQLVVISDNGCTDTLSKTICITDVTPIGNIDTSGSGIIINSIFDYTDGGVPITGGGTQGCLIQIDPMTGDTTFVDSLGLNPVNCLAAYNMYTGCLPLTLSLTDSSTAFPDSIVAWYWNFGDGNTSSVQNPTHTYTTSSGEYAYLVTLTVYNTFGVFRTDSVTLVQPTQPTAYFNLSRNTVCTDQIIAAADSSSGRGLTYQWTFENGDTSTLTAPTFSYSTEGTYEVCLTVTDRNGCDSLYCDSVLVINPIAAFTADTTYSDCDSLQVLFTNASLNDVSWVWDFGTGDTSHLESPSVTYSGTGYYDVLLIATGISGCQDTVTQSSLVRIDGPLVTSYGLSPTDSCVSHTVSFNVQGENIALITIEYGNGQDTTFTTSTAAIIDTTITYTYEIRGTYYPILKVVDALNCERIWLFDSVSTTMPVASFTMDTTLGCVPLILGLNASASEDVFQYQWTAPGAIISGQGTATPNIRYNNQGYYSDVTLIVTDINNCKDTLSFTDTITAAGINVGFYADNYTGCFPLTVNFTDTSAVFPDTISTWFWQFVGTDTDTLQNPTYLYNDIANANRRARLTVTSSYGCTAAVQKNILPTFPTAKFTSDTLVCTTQLVTFSNQSTGLGLSYSWDFGDNGTSTATNPTHLYTSEDTFKIVLTVTDQNGCIAQDSVDRVVVANPLANFNSDKQYISCPPDSIQFTDLSLNADAWQWTISGTSPGVYTEQNPSVVYTTPGFYDVQLIITSFSGCFDTIQIDSLIRVDGPYGVLTATPKQGCVDLSVDFTAPLNNTEALIFNSNDLPSIVYISPGDTFNVTHIYTQRGTYKPSVIIQDSLGCQRTLKDGNIIVTDPEPVFTVSPDTSCLPFTLTTTNTSLDVNNFEWIYSSGTISSPTAYTPTFAITDTGYHTVSLVITDIYGCTDTASHTFLATDIFPAATSSVTNGCRPLTVQFNDLTTVFPDSVVSWIWNFGGSEGTSTQQNPVHIYPNIGTYTPSLTVTNAYGCSKTVTLPQIKTTFPSVSYTPSLTYACTGQDILFDNHSTGQTLTYAWDFNNGVTSTQNDVTYAFPTEGTYNVCLTTTDINGCDSTFCKIITIADPVANFTVDTVYRPCPPATFQFTDLSVNAVAWSWTFGDGNTSTAQSPSHTYTQTGFYDVQLIVTTASGCMDTLFKPTYIEVGGPVGNFTFTPKQGCADVIATFNGNVTANTVDFYIWTFGDNSSTTNITNANTNTVSHTYTKAGRYFPTLTLQDFTGCQFIATLDSIEVDTLQFDFFANDTLLCEVGSLNFTPFIASSSPIDSVRWNFAGADITTSDLMMPTISYSAVGDFDVTLTVYSRHCTKTITKTQYVKIAPIPNNDFTTIPAAGCNPTTVFFTDNSTIFSGNIVNWNWTFGDGGTAATQNTAHSYQAVGSYDVRLITVSNHGCSDTLLFVDTVTIYPIPHPIFDLDTFACTGQDVFFVNNSTGNNLTYNWNFGDGNVSTAFEPVHQYATEGTFTVCLTVLSSDGCDSTICKSVLIANPVANFNSSVQYLACPNDSITFSDLSINAIAWFWRFGDGDSSVLQSPIHTYLETGVYDVQLIVTGLSGCQDTLLRPAYIEIGGPVGNFTFTPNQGCADVTATFTGNVTANTVDFYIWNYGDGTIDTVFTNAATNTITHTYNTTGTYFPTMTIEDFTGCQFIATLDSIEVDTLQFDFFANDTLLCEVGNFTFTPFIASSSPIDSVAWNFGGADVTTSNLMMPTISYSTVGDFDVTLTVYSRHCTKTITKTQYIKIAPIPNSGFATVPTVGCNPTTVFFTDTTNIFSGNVVSWAWNFGDGGVDSTQNPGHSYQTADTFDVQLITVSEYGCADSITYANLIIINPIPHPAFVLDTFACTGQAVFFVNNSTGNNLTYNWNFGDGNASNIFEPVHQYTNEGTFTVCLTVTDINGCDSTTCQALVIANPVAAFTSNTQYLGCPPDSIQFIDNSINAIAWNWSFGDDSVSTQQNPTHTYTATGFYDVQLIVTGLSGCFDTLLQTNYIEVGGPIGHFAFTPKQGCADVAATFVGTLTNNSVTQYHWNFGNGDSITHVSNMPIDSFEYVYTTSGTYFPTLTFEDSTGCTFFFELDSIEVDTLEFNFFANDTVFCETANITFNPYIASSSPIDSVLWTFSGAMVTTSTSMIPTIPYDTIGDFNVTLTVFSNHCSKTITKTQYIKAAPIPNSYFTTATNPFCSEQTISFLDAHSIFSGSVVDWQWDFGDLATSSLQNPTHTYADSGFYNMNLLVTSEYGCTDDTTITVYINKTPNPAMTPAPILCIGEVFTLTASGGATYAWYNGFNLVCDTCTSIDVAPILTTNYTLIATSAAGCHDTISQTVSVLPYAIPPLVVSNDTTICKGDVIQLFASGGYDVTQYQWDNSVTGLTCYNGCSNPFAAPTTTTTFYVTLTWDGGCSKTDSITVTVIDDASPILGIDRTICLGESVQLGISTGGSAIWTPSEGLSCKFCDNPIASPLLTTTYAVEVTTPNGCIIRDTLIVNVQTPDMINAGDDVTICIGTAIPLEGVGIGTVTWSPAATLSNANILNPTASPIVTTDYILTVQNDLCIQTDTVTITIADKVDINIADLDICEGETVEIDVQGYADSYIYTPENGVLTVNPTLIQPTETTTYTVIGSIPSCESDTTVFTITVNPIPDIGLLPSMVVFKNSTTPLPIDYPNARYMHTWTPSTQLSCPDCFDPFFIADTTFEAMTIYVDLLTQDGCSFTDSIVVTLTENCGSNMVQLPSAFTPNGDGQNDIFRVRALGLADIEIFRVYNRWGEQMFSTSLINEGWDGTYKGQPVEQGVYSYYVQAICPLTGDILTFKGDVFLHF
jgi:gliding motility-associated-like protein